jgi:integrase
MNYTIPTINFGKKPKSIPKGSNLQKELIKNYWNINYSFNGKQYRVKDGINRIHSYKERLAAAEILRDSIIHDLKNGFDPENPEIYYSKLTKKDISLKDAIENYKLDLKEHAKKKTIESYSSKLHHLLYQYQSKKLHEITTNNIEKFIRGKINNTENDIMYQNGKFIEINRVTKWTPKTILNARRIYKTFFNWCAKSDQSYIEKNPLDELELKKIKSNVAPKISNVPFEEDDLKKLMEHLDLHYPFEALFCRFIYFTLIRPGEICNLKVQDVKMNLKIIIVPVEVMKASTKIKHDEIPIADDLYKILTRLNISNYPGNYYLFSEDKESVFGEVKFDYDKVYKLLKKVFKELEMDNKGYTLYGFKHTSNIKRFNSGWKLTEIMKANRHTDVQMTLEYLKNITHQTDITNLKFPSI